MEWDKPVDIIKNADGSYTRWGQRHETKPYWSFGTPRIILASILLLVLLGWMTLGGILISPLVSIITGAILFIFTFYHFYRAQLARMAT